MRKPLRYMVLYNRLERQMMHQVENKRWDLDQLLKVWERFVAWSSREMERDRKERLSRN